MSHGDIIFRMAPPERSRCGIMMKGYDFLKVLLIGCGAVGLGVTASLFDAGVDVQLVASARTKSSIEQNGISRTGLFKPVHVQPSRIRAFETAEDTPGGYDFVLICVKTTANYEIAESLHKNQGVLKSGGKIVILQNGFGTSDPFLKYFSKNQVCSARVITGFDRPEPYISRITAHSAPLLIGSLYEKDVTALEKLAQAITKGGIPSETCDEIDKALWAKMLYNCTLNPLGAVLSVNYGKLAHSSAAVSIMNRLMEEIFAVMTAAGYSSYWDNVESCKKDFYEKILPPTYEHRASTLQDVERKIKTEIDTLNGAVVRLGDKYGVDVSYNRMICSLIKAKESYYSDED